MESEFRLTVNGAERRVVCGPPPHWTEPDSSCRRIPPAQNSSPHSERHPDERRPG
jgi:hypothetical protein